MLFYPGLSGKFTKATSYRVQDMRYRPNFRGSIGLDALRYDYALLKLEQKVPSSSYIELGVDYAFEDEPLGIIGYRGPACSY
jgi:hypothetical protein